VALGVHQDGLLARELELHGPAEDVGIVGAGIVGLALTGGL